METTSWYIIDDVEQLDTPALVIYKDRVSENIARLIQQIDDVKRLRPHVKTHKSAEVASMMMAEGINKFKCATIAEAEMLGSVKAADVLLAYQPVGPKATRLAKLCKKFPKTKFSCLIDDISAAHKLSSIMEKESIKLSVYIDVNVGMNRTGVKPEAAEALWHAVAQYPGIAIVGLHAYDGHLRDPDPTVRATRCDDAFKLVAELQSKLQSSGNALTIVAGGTPTYSIHAKRKNIECSPGTFIYWDKGYETILSEQNYQHAAVIITRVISKPTTDTICVDLGHKSIASENPIQQRVYFLNAGQLEPIGHSEEHMVLRMKASMEFNVGDVLYGIPYHVCPTVALYNKTVIVENHTVTDAWETRSRNRELTI